MFDIGFQELIIIFLVALLVFGPEKLPEVGKTLGRWLSMLRNGIQNAKTQMETEFHESEKTGDKEAEMIHGVAGEKKEEGHTAEEKKEEG